MTGLPVTCGVITVLFGMSTSFLLVVCRTGLGFLAAFIQPHAAQQVLPRQLGDLAGEPLASQISLTGTLNKPV